MKKTKLINALRDMELAMEDMCFNGQTVIVDTRCIPVYSERTGKTSHIVPKLFFTISKEPPRPADN